MPNCCGGATCACVVEEGPGISIIGSGTAQDPFEISADLDLNVVDTTVFNLTLAGAGTVVSPWSLTVAFAATAKLDDLPDVNAPTPTNAQVLGWDNATSKWTPRAPTTAASGSVQHDTSMSGDGSGGSPLSVDSDTANEVETRAGGVGLTDYAQNSLVRRYANAAARTAETLAPTLNTISMLDTNPGVQEYWDGGDWVLLPDSFDTVLIGNELLELSGPYVGTRLTRVVKNLSTSTDVTGVFDALTAAELVGYAGVLSILVTPTDPSDVGVPWTPMMYGNVTKVSGVSYRVDDGTPWTGVSVTAIIEAWLY